MTVSPEVPSGFYPAIEIWNGIINTLKSSAYIAQEIKNARDNTVTIYEEPLTDITAAMPDRGLAVWFKNEVDFLQGDNLETTTYKYYIDIQKQRSTVTEAIQENYKFCENVKRVIENSIILQGLAQYVRVHKFEPVEPPRKSGNFYTFTSCAEVEVITSGYYR